MLTFLCTILILIEILSHLRDFKFPRPEEGGTIFFKNYSVVSQKAYLLLFFYECQTHLGTTTSTCNSTNAFKDLIEDNTRQY